MQEVKSPLWVFVGMKRNKVGQGRSDVGTLIVRAVMGHDTAQMGVAMCGM